jgi:hypothetical protein
MGCFGKLRGGVLAKEGAGCAGLGYLGMAILWIGVSFGLKAMEHSGCVFDLNAVCESKALGVALLWIGRFCYFPQARLELRARFWCALAGLLLAGSGVSRVTSGSNPLYLVLVGADTLLWTLGLTVLLETLGAVYYRRWVMATPPPSRLEQEWRLYWRDSLKLGAWLALLAGLAFFYLVSFYRFDVYFYSRGLTVLWLGTQLIFGGIAYWRLTDGIRAKIVLLEREIGTYLEWPDAGAAELVDQWLPLLQYLLLCRDYLKGLRRPALSGWTVGGLALLAGFLLGLPQIIGAVIKV